MYYFEPDVNYIFDIKYKNVKRFLCIETRIQYGYLDEVTMEECNPNKLFRVTLTGSLPVSNQTANPIEMTITDKETMEIVDKTSLRDNSRLDGASSTITYIVRKSGGLLPPQIKTKELALLVLHYELTTRAKNYLNFFPLGLLERKKILNGYKFSSKAVSYACKKLNYLNNKRPNINLKQPSYPLSGMAIDINTSYQFHQRYV